MFLKRTSFCMAFGLVCAVSPSLARASKELRITIPRHSELTPVQRLNRDGVDALLEHRYEHAEDYFYKAYLYDPADPFTLTNLGYVSELQGEVGRAEKFYRLAAEQGCYAIIDRSSLKALDGKPMMDALGTLKESPMHINRMNMMGMELLLQDRPFEAEGLLKQALVLDPQNPYTLNNLGVAEEATGDLEDALKDYDEAAASRSMEPVIVTSKRLWRGKPVSEMAADSAQNLRKRMKKMNLGQIRAAMLAVRGVSATNQNDWSAARKDFIEAYSLDPQSAFALNNLGYVAERDGDFETAKSFYARARRAGNADARIGFATQSFAQGQPLFAVASESHQDMDIDLNAYSEAHRGLKSTFELKRRNEPSEKPGASSVSPSSMPQPEPDPSTYMSPQ